MSPHHNAWTLLHARLVDIADDVKDVMLQLDAIRNTSYEDAAIQTSDVMPTPNLHFNFSTLRPTQDEIWCTSVLGEMSTSKSNAGPERAGSPGLGSLRSLSPLTSVGDSPNRTPGPADGDIPVLTNDSPQPTTLGLTTLHEYPPQWHRQASSRYTTPSESGPRPMQEHDEDEVWCALMLSETSGMSTPLSNPDTLTLPMMSSVGSPAQEQLSVDPSVLYDSPPDDAPHEVDSLLFSDRTLSPLTSVGDTSDMNARARTGMTRNQGDGGRPIASNPPQLLLTPTLQTTFSASSGGSLPALGRAQEQLTIDPPALHDSPPNDVPQEAGSPLFSERSLTPLTSVGDASDMDATPTCGEGAYAATDRIKALGGPDATPGTLAALARRAPLKIWLKVPGMKRKRDVNDECEGQDGDRRKHKLADAHDEVQGPEKVSPSGVGGADGRAPEGPPSIDEVDQSDVPVPPERRKTHHKANESASVPSSRVIQTPSTPATPRPRGQRTKQHRGPHPHRGRPARAFETAESVSPVKYYVRKGQTVSVPLEVKRVSRQRENVTNPSSSSAAAPRREARRGTGGWDAGTWPVIGGGAFGNWEAQFILCDSCEMWYHYGCVAIASGDPRLEPGVTFICPACQIGSGHVNDREDTCGRPDCPEPDRVGGDAEHFFVERLVGRKRIKGDLYIWLAKWEGYPMSQATWIPRENVVGDGGKLFDTFAEDAIGEGADMSRDVVLLLEAREAGW